MLVLHKRIKHWQTITAVDELTNTSIGKSTISFSSVSINCVIKYWNDVHSFNVQL